MYGPGVYLTKGTSRLSFARQAGQFFKDTSLTTQAHFVHFTSWVLEKNIWKNY